ncbi:hypothetical protein HQ531_00180 [bacterium]|nr:hypothetical protein [bacterium]
MRVLLLIIVMGVIPLFGQGDGFGIGLALKDGVGLAAKYWLNQKAALAGVINQNGVQADYQLHNYDKIRPEEGRNPVYYGLGINLGTQKADDDTEVSIGVRVPLGILSYYQKDNYDLDFYLDLVPTLDVTPNTHFWVDGSIGFRYYF